MCVCIIYVRSIIYMCFMCVYLRYKVTKKKEVTKKKVTKKKSFRTKINETKWYNTKHIPKYIAKTNEL